MHDPNNGPGGASPPEEGDQTASGEGGESQEGESSGDNGENSGE